MKRMHKDTLIGLYKTRVLGHRKTDRTRLTLAITTLTLSLLFMPYVITAQTATMAGKVTDELTGEPLQGAELTLEATGLSATTDRDGRYILRNIPPDTHNLSIRFPAYVSKEMAITVSAGERLAQTLELQQSFADGDKIFVEAAQRDRAQVVAAQQHSKQIKSVVTLEQINRWGDASIQEALIRIPGVQAGSQGDINLRGAGLNRYYVTVDGQRIGSTGLGDRSVNLDMLPVDLYRELEVINVLSPDMDADAIGGVINLTTYQPVGRERALNVTLGGDANAQYFDFTGPGNRASIRYSETLTDELALAVNLSHQLTHQSWERLEIDYDVADFGNGPVDVVERVAPGLHNDSRRSVGGGLHLTYQPSDWATYHLRSLINSNNHLVNAHKNVWAANENWIDSHNVTAGLYNYDVGLKDIDNQQYLVQGSANYIFNEFNLGIELELSRSVVDYESLIFPFQMNGLDYSLNVEDNLRPIIVTADPPPIESHDMILQTIEHISSKQVDNRYMGNVDIEIPFAKGLFNVGTRAQLKSKDVGDLGAFTFFRLNYRGFMNLGGFEKNHNGTTVLGQYDLPWLANPDALQNFYVVNAPGMIKDHETMHIESDFRNIEISENIFAGYGMSTLHFGRLTLKGGARLEFTKLQNNGRLTDFDRFGGYNLSIDTSRVHHHIDLFPNAQLIYKPMESTKLHLSYTQSIARPAFQMLAPFEFANRQDTTLIRGNMELEPVSADNVDFFIDHYLANLGNISMNLFYKRLKNFAAFQQQTIHVQEGEFKGIDPMFSEETSLIPVKESSFYNSGESATLYGAGFSWHQNITFLPGILSNLGIYANYTWTGSTYKTNNENNIALPGQSPHVVNGALHYTQARFFAQLSYHFTDRLISNPSLIEPASSFHSQDNLFPKQNLDGWTDLSFSFMYRISDHFRFWADVSNLLKREQVLYNHSHEASPSLTDYYGGHKLRMGIRFDL
ncbi:MAG: TonB-dependent receptor [Balneolales bacterium]